MIACMKGFSSFGAILILLVGLAMTGITVYGYFHSQIFLDNTSVRDIILSIFSGACALIIVGSIIGMCGIKKGNGCLICIFQIFVIIFLIIFFILGIMVIILPNQFFQGNCQISNNKAIEEAYDAYFYSQSMLCKPGLCPCNMNANILAGYNQKDRNTLITKYSVNNSNGVTTSKQCPFFPQQDQIFANILGQIQDFLKCSMWCQGVGDNLFYRYSSINNGKPKSYCYNELEQSVTSYGKTIGIGAFVACVFMLFVCICNLCICCHKDRRSLNMRERFVYIDQAQNGYQNLNQYSNPYLNINSINSNENFNKHINPYYNKNSSQNYNQHTNPYFNQNHNPYTRM